MTIIEAVWDYLTEELTGVPVYTEIPETMPDTFVLIEKTSGGETNFIQKSMITIQSWASSLAEADTLNETVKTAMRNVVTVDMITSCRLNSDYNYTDTGAKNYRYQAVFDIAHY